MRAGDDHVGRRFDQGRRRFGKLLVGDLEAAENDSEILPLDKAIAAQEAGRTYRLGVLVPTVSRQAPPVLALLDELRRNGFVEGQNLTLVFGGFEIANEQLPEAAAALSLIHISEPTRRS